MGTGDRITGLSEQPSILIGDKATVTHHGQTSMILPRHPDYRKNDPDWPDPQPMAIGYWYSEDQTHLPHPQDFLFEGWHPDQKKAVLAHLRKGEVEHQWRGDESWCRLCGTRQADNGSKCLTDGVYVWPEGFAHYIEDHGVKPPKEFIEHALNFAVERPEIIPLPTMADLGEVEATLAIGLPAESHSITFTDAEAEEVLRIAADGSIYHRGTRIEEDRRIYEALCDALGIAPH